MVIRTIPTLSPNSNFGRRPHGVLWIRCASPIRSSLPVTRLHGGGRQGTSGWHRARCSLDSDSVTSHTHAVHEDDITQSRARSLVLRKLHLIILKETQQGMRPQVSSLTSCSGRYRATPTILSYLFSCPPQWSLPSDQPPL